MFQQPYDPHDLDENHRDPIHHSEGTSKGSPQDPTKTIPAQSDKMILALR